MCLRMQEEAGSHPLPAQTHTHTHTHTQACTQGCGILVTLAGIRWPSMSHRALLLEAQCPVSHVFHSKNQANCLCMGWQWKVCACVCVCDERTFGDSGHRQLFTQFWSNSVLTMVQRSIIACAHNHCMCVRVCVCVCSCSCYILSTKVRIFWLVLITLKAYLRV